MLQRPRWRSCRVCCKTIAPRNAQTDDEAVLVLRDCSMPPRQRHTCAIRGHCAYDTFARVRILHGGMNGGMSLQATLDRDSGCGWSYTVVAYVLPTNVSAGNRSSPADAMSPSVFVLPDKGSYWAMPASSPQHPTVRTTPHTFSLPCLSPPVRDDVQSPLPQTCAPVSLMLTRSITPLPSRAGK